MARFGQTPYWLHLVFLIVLYATVAIYKGFTFHVESLLISSTTEVHFKSRGLFILSGS